jgi:hypothetical protein
LYETSIFPVALSIFSPQKLKNLGDEVLLINFNVLLGLPKFKRKPSGSTDSTIPATCAVIFIRFSASPFLFTSMPTSFISRFPVDAILFRAMVLST